MSASPLSGIVGGIVRGEFIHGACATDEDLQLTWAAFYTKAMVTREREALICARCGNTLKEGPKS